MNKLFGLLSLFVAMLTRAENYSLDWVLIFGGVGTSTNGQYSVSGTMGQEAAGQMSGGEFSFIGGFWPPTTLPPEGERTALFIEWSGDSVIVSWSPATAGFQLQTTAHLTGAVWTAAPIGNPVRLQISDAARFYRLTKP